MSDDEKYTARQILDEAWNYHGFGGYAVNFVQAKMCSKLGENWHWYHDRKYSLVHYLRLLKDHLSQWNPKETGIVS